MTAKNYFRRISLILFLFISTYAQGDIIINEIMYAPSSGQPEWVEIYNRSSNTYNLANWKLSDAVGPKIITTNLVTIQPGEFVILARDASIGNFFNINTQIVVLSSWPALNNTGDDLILLNSASQIMDSLTYSPSWGGSSGNSLERIDIDSSSTDQTNWGTSTSPNKGTPGSKNSIAPKDNDITVTGISISPFPIVEGFDLSAFVKVLNLGTLAATSYSLELYNDTNNDTTIQANELVNRVSLTNLASGDSVSQEYPLGSLLQGSYQLIAVVNLDTDEATFNDTLIYNFEVLPPPPPFNSIVVNEVMYDPSNGEPEWVEIYNRSDETYDLQYWKFADGASTNTITYQSALLAPNEYVILTGDASISNFYNINATVIVMADFPGLNNSGDNLVLMDQNSFVIDSLNYSRSWGGEDGKSLERINPNQPSIDPENWGTSVSANNATPGIQNSIFPPLIDISINSLTITPSEPNVNSEITATITVNNFGLNSASSFTINLYNDINLDSTTQTNELITTVQFFNLASGNSLTHNFNIGSYPVGDLRLIAVANITGDENTENNKLVENFTIKPNPPASHDVVINEIMYAPSSGEPEWIEIYNRSTTSYLLTGWQLSDASSNKNITDSLIRIEPDEYIVLANDDAINDFYNISSKIIVIDMPSLNNSGDLLSLKDFNSDVIDQVSYLPSWGGDNGNSLERIDPFGESSIQSNWASSISPYRATPGQINSVVPREYDLAVTYFDSPSSFLFKDEETVFKTRLKNVGTNTISGASLKFFYDANNDSSFTQGELLNEFTNIELAPNNEIEKVLTFSFTNTGTAYLLATIVSDNDINPINDSLFLSKEIIEPNIARGEIVINEFLYAPNSPFPEWIELYNTTDIPQQLRNFALADSKDTVVISRQNILIPANSFLVISRDSIITELYDIPTNVLITEFPSLNNSGDRIMLLDNYQRVIDSLEYNSSWGGTNGKSLERIDPSVESSLQSNWGTSVSPNGATPGGTNSIVPHDFDLAVTYFDFTSPYLFNGEESKFIVKVKNLGVNAVSNGAVDVYYDWNGDAFFSTGDQKREFTNLELAPEEEIELKGSFTINITGTAYFLAASKLNTDTYTQNDSLLLSKEVIEPTITRGQIVINEFLYAPNSPYPEWIELYNTTDIPQQLRNFAIADSRDTVVISKQNILIPGNSYLTIANDSIFTQLYDIHSGFVISEFPSLNNSGDRIMLLDNYNRVIDSLEYSSSWGGNNGKSLERINSYAESSLQSNWGTSVSPNGATPGEANSVEPREFDLAVINFDSPSSFLLKDEESVLTVRLKNTGTNNITGGALKIYLDSNGDSLFTENELLKEYSNLELATNEEIDKIVTHSFTSTGSKYMLAVSNYENDVYPENDSLSLFKEVIEPNVNRGNIVINEFLYAPDSPYAEWIELYNTTDIPQQLRNFAIADSRDTVVISTQNILIPENSYIVIAKDSIITQLYDIPSSVIVTGFPSLNNSGDRIMLLDNYGRIIDSLEYSSDWGGEEGKSLERVNPFGNSSTASNWATTIDIALGTPGKVNSVAPKGYDVAVDDFYSTPAQPAKGETVSLSAKVVNAGTNAAAFSLILYESNSAGEKVQVLETVQINEMSPTEERTINFDYKIESFSTDRFFIAEVNFDQDQNTTNNSKLLLVASPTIPLSVVINEIMFDPDGDEPEWIELYNRSANSINLKDWEVSDVVTTPKIEAISRQDIFVEPGEYIVLSKDSNIFDYHPGLLKDQVILVSFATLNNTNDGVVIYGRLGNVIDSVFYGDNFSKKSGYSIERLSTEDSSNASSNWAVSISSEKGTPGFVNSHVPKNNDLAVVDITIDPEFPELGNSITISASVQNLGLVDASSFTIKFISTDLGINETIDVSSLEIEKTEMVSLSSSYNMPESFEITVQVTYDEDENLSNNALTKTFYSGFAPSSVLVNEVMYDPNADGTEWVEFINATNYGINLYGWKVAEGSTFDSPRTFNEENIVIQPGEYFIIADDTSGGKFADVTSPVFEVNFGELNSSEDIVAIFDFRGALIDSLKYSSSWGGGDGYSLERVSLQSSTNLRTNWLSSIVINGSTPGSPNSTASISQSEEKQIVINEIMFEPESDNSEFIEFFNTSDQFVEIANWTVEDNSKNNTTLTRNTFTISPESYFVVAADSSILLNYPELKEFKQLLIVNRSLSLNNSDDLILLSDAFGDVIDSVYYNSLWNNKKVITTKNKSLERINPFLNGNDNNNWSTSVASEGATPGKANSIYIENQTSNNSISLSPNPFSPDGDGYEDFVIINYNLPRDATSIQIKVFDSKGRKVRTINENNIFGKQGSIVFNGYNDDGQPLKIGIYILFIEALNSSSGTVDTFKEVVVVARKL